MLDLGAKPPCVFDGTYEEYQSYKSIKAAQETSVSPGVQAKELSGSKEQFLASKEQAAQKRKLEKRKIFVKDEIERIEKELDRISAELEGDAASDYILADKLYKEQVELEETLMALYEENEGYQNEK